MTASEVWKFSKNKSSAPTKPIVKTGVKRSLKRSRWRSVIEYLPSFEYLGSLLPTPNTLSVISQISNGHIFIMGHPIHLEFGSMVWFVVSANWMTLFPVRSNPRWRSWHDRTWHNTTWHKISIRAKWSCLLPNYYAPCLINTSVWQVYLCWRKPTDSFV